VTKHADIVFNFDLTKLRSTQFNGYVLLRQLERRPLRSPLLMAYYARSRANKKKLFFIKMSTYYRNRPTNSYRKELAENHARFWQMNRLKSLFAIEGIPKIIKVGVFDPPKDEGPPDGIELDFMVSEFVGEVDLRDYVTANNRLQTDLNWLKKFGRFPKDHFTGFDTNWGDGIKSNFWREERSHVFPGFKPKQWYFVARLLTKHLKRIHNRGFIHGDLTINSVRLTLKPDFKFDVTLIDFEESSLLADLLQKRGIDHGYPEKAEETHDINGLGKILFFLASGKEWDDVKREEADRRGMPEPKDLKLSKSETQELVGRFVFDQFSVEEPDRKHHVRTTSQFKEDVLYRGIAKIIDKCLRDAETDQYLCCEDIIEEMDLLDLDANSDPKVDELDGVEGAEHVQAIANEMQAKGSDFLKLRYENSGSTLFHSIWISRVEQLKSSFAALSRKHYEIHGDREELIDHLTRALAGLREDDVYLTLTHPSYWSQNNLGSHGRFLSMNQMIAVRRRVHTIRLFVLNDSQSASKATRDMLEIHHVFQRTLRERGVGFLQTKKELHDFINQGKKKDDIPLSLPEVLKRLRLNRHIGGQTIYFTGVVKTEDQHSPLSGFNTILTSSSHVALVLSKTSKTCVSITFHDHPEKEKDEMDFGATAARRIHKVRFAIVPWKIPSQSPTGEPLQDFLRAMGTNFMQALDLDEFFSQPNIVRHPISAANSATAMFPGAEEVPDE
jgi:hypothetical protein